MVPGLGWILRKTLVLIVENGGKWWSTRIIDFDPQYVDISSLKPCYCMYVSFMYRNTQAAISRWEAANPYIWPRKKEKCWLYHGDDMLYTSTYADLYTRFTTPRQIGSIRNLNRLPASTWWSGASATYHSLHGLQHHQTSSCHCFWRVQSCNLSIVWHWVILIFLTVWVLVKVILSREASHFAVLSLFQLDIIRLKNQDHDHETGVGKNSWWDESEQVWEIPSCWRLYYVFCGLSCEFYPQKQVRIIIQGLAGSRPRTIQRIVGGSKKGMNRHRCDILRATSWLDQAYPGLIKALQGRLSFPNGSNEQVNGIHPYWENLLGPDGSRLWGFQSYGFQEWTVPRVEGSGPRLDGSKTRVKNKNSALKRSTALLIHPTFIYRRATLWGQPAADKQLMWIIETTPSGERKTCCSPSLGTQSQDLQKSCTSATKNTVLLYKSILYIYILYI